MNDEVSHRYDSTLRGSTNWEKYYTFFLIIIKLFHPTGSLVEVNDQAAGRESCGEDAGQAGGGWRGWGEDRSRGEEDDDATTSHSIAKGAKNRLS